MWTLPLPDVAEVHAQIDQAFARRAGPPVYALSIEERTALTELYAAYDHRRGIADAVLNPVALAQARDAIHDAYDQVQVRGRLKTLRGRLLANVLECPLCGFGEPKTLDHFLPRGNYRSLAIYPRNLLPSCQPCNRKKGTEVASAEAGFIHGYFQELPNDVFLQSTATYISPTLTVAFRILGPAHNPALIQSLQHQLEQLELNDRYGPQINTLLFSLKPSLLGFLTLPDPTPRIQDFFARSAESYAADFGLNHWRAALMRGLSECAEFCADLTAYFAAGRVVAVG